MDKLPAPRKQGKHYPERGNKGPRKLSQKRSFLAKEAAAVIVNGASGDGSGDVTTVRMSVGGSLTGRLRGKAPLPSPGWDSGRCTGCSWSLPWRFARASLPLLSTRLAPSSGTPVSSPSPGASPLRGGGTFLGRGDDPHRAPAATAPQSHHGLRPDGRRPRARATAGPTPVCAEDWPRCVAGTVNRKGNRPVLTELSDRSCSVVSGGNPLRVTAGVCVQMSERRF
jgi:hypothetical protein